jgi:hypothetical protein
MGLSYIVVGWKRKRNIMTLKTAGALVLGTVIGYLAHYLVRRDPEPGVEDLGAIVGVVLGSVVFNVITGQDQTSWYLIGLGVGFFLYWLALLAGREQVKKLRQEMRALPILPFLKNKQKT